MKNENILTKKELDILLREHKFLKKYDVEYRNVNAREERENSKIIELSTAK